MKAPLSQTVDPTGGQEDDALRRDLSLGLHRWRVATDGHHRRRDPSETL